MKKISKIICSVGIISGAIFIPTVQAMAEKTIASDSSTHIVSENSVNSSLSSSDTNTIHYVSEESKTDYPKGNGTVIQNVDNDVVDRQFVTMQSKNGNTFYLVIDKDSEGNESVYFMNLVDEYDLLAFAEDFPDEVKEKQDSSVSNLVDSNFEDSLSDESENVMEQTSTNESKGGNSMIIIIIGVLAIGGGAFYYFKVYKNKIKNAKQADYSYEDEDYEEETENEDNVSNE